MFTNLLRSDAASMVVIRSYRIKLSIKSSFTRSQRREPSWTGKIFSWYGSTTSNWQGNTQLGWGFVHSISLMITSLFRVSLFCLLLLNRHRFKVLLTCFIFQIKRRSLEAWRSPHWSCQTFGGTSFIRGKIFDSGFKHFPSRMIYDIDLFYRDYGRMIKQLEYRGIGRLRLCHESKLVRRLKKVSDKVFKEDTTQNKGNNKPPEVSELSWAPIDFLLLWTSHFFHFNKCLFCSNRISYCKNID